MIRIQKSRRALHQGVLNGQWTGHLEINQLSQEITNALAKFKTYDVVNNSWGAI